MLAVAFFAVLYVVVSVLLSSDKDARVMPTQLVDLSTIKQGEHRIILWDGRPVIVYRRSLEDTQFLEVAHAEHRAVLNDPDSKRSRQPTWALNAFRSKQPEWFISIGVGTDFSCPIGFSEASNERVQQQPWRGGFTDDCRGSKYDLAGRVYKGQYATKNLIVPNYTIRGTTLVLGGSD